MRRCGILDNRGSEFLRAVGSTVVFLILGVSVAACTNNTQPSVTVPNVIGSSDARASQIFQDHHVLATFVGPHSLPAQTASSGHAPKRLVVVEEDPSAGKTVGPSATVTARLGLK